MSRRRVITTIRMRRPSTPMLMVLSLLCGSFLLYTGIIWRKGSLESGETLPSPRSLLLSPSSSLPKGVLRMQQDKQPQEAGQEDNQKEDKNSAKDGSMKEEEEEGRRPLKEGDEEEGRRPLKEGDEEEGRGPLKEGEEEEEERSESRNAAAEEEEEKDATAAQPLLRMVVLSYNRAASLARCLQSLNEAEYDGLPAVVDIHIDRAKDGSVHNQTVTVARQFSFKHGDTLVTVRPQHGGVVGQWLGSWKVPQDDNAEIVVFLEDDLTVSPFFGRWLRLLHAKYDSYNAISGYSLQAETVRHSSDTDYSLLKGPPGQFIFAYPVLGSWGFSPITARWREFLRWYGEASKDAKFLPLVKGLKPTGWYRQAIRSGRRDSMWTQWHIYHTDKLKQFTLYPHFPDKQGLSFNWKEAGEHYSSAASGKGLKERLLTSWPSPDLTLPDSLTVLDTKGRLMKKKLTPAGLQ